MRRVLFSAALLSIAVLSACGGGTGNGGGGNTALASIQVTDVNSNLTVGSTQQMTATGHYTNGSTQNLTSSVTWTSSDTTIATVDSRGMVTAKEHGDVKISATMNGVGGSANLTVTATLVSISVSATTLSIASATSEQFTATGTYNDGSTQNITSNVTWASSYTAVATISSSNPTQGLAKALSAGTTSITATSGSITGSTTLTVTSATVTSIAVSPSSADVPIGIAQQFTATGTFSDSSTQDITGVVAWKSSSPGVASITVSGLATALNIGSTTISATLTGVTGSAPLTVNAANLKSLSITPGSPTIAQGTKISFTAIGTFNDGSTRTMTNQVTWTSSDTTVATVASNGIATGQTRAATGTTTITATLGSATTSTDLTVTNATISSITVAPVGKTIPIGGQVGFRATGLFSDSSSQDITSICKWTSSDTTIAKVGSGGGSLLTATGVGPGTTNINATFNGVTGSVALTISSATLVSINLTPTDAVLAPASTLGYSAVGIYSDGSQNGVNGTATWTSSDTSVATINGSGTATGQSAGAVTITAQVGTVSANADLIVEGSALTGIQITPGTMNLPKTIQRGFTATGIFANGQQLDITSVVTWTSSNGSVATISNATGSEGVATGIAAGSTTISATFGSQAGTATLNVTNATLTDISISPANATLNLGNTQQYTAMGTFSDSSSFGITLQVDWSSSDVSVAVIDTNGVLTTAGAGTATIKATLNGVTDTTGVTVH